VVADRCLRKLREAARSCEKLREGMAKKVRRRFGFASWLSPAERRTHPCQGGLLSAVGGEDGPRLRVHEEEPVPPTPDIPCVHVIHGT